MMFRTILAVSFCAFALCMYTADPAKWNRHQYLVKVLTKDAKIGNISTCSGSLLSPSVVLTSAKCFPENTKDLIAQAIIKNKDSSDTMNKAMLAVRIEGDFALMKIDAVQDEHFCDKEPHPARVARLNFKPSLIDATYKSIEPKSLQDVRCRLVGFTTKDDVEDFATSQDVQVLELDVRADEESLMFSEVNGNSTGRACWDDIGAPLECVINDDSKWVQVGILHGIFGREMEEDTNSTMPVSCSDVQTMQFVVFSDDSFAHAIEKVDKTSVFESQDKCF